MPALAQQPPDPVKSDSLANTAVGTDALFNVDLDEYGCHNTAIGDDALYSDKSGSYNTANGFSSLYTNTTGNNNTAAGYESLFNNSVGNNNTASGYQALYANTKGSDNTAIGYQTLSSNISGTHNTAVGTGALNYNQTGSYQTALGYNAGQQASGTDNIDIANVGSWGESHTLRLGTQGSAGVEGSGIVTTYIAGIVNSKITGSAVYVTANGQLGVLASSERYKTDVQTMGGSSERLSELRPVSFKLKTDPEGTVQYGLIAEEVVKVYPELVTRNADGRIEGVRYEELAPMLLNELQQQRQKLAAQETINSAQAAQISAQAAEISELQQQQQFATREELSGLQRQLQAALAELQSAKALVAQR